MTLKQNTVPYNITTPNNMGVVRYLLAFAVLIAHFNELAGASLFFPLSSYSAVGGFFALSGFLVYGSYLKRPSPGRYLKARARRILPAYWITVLLAAIALCALTTLSPAEYFSSAGFWKYLAANLSFLNFLAPDLPGVFTQNAVPAVNGSLWTMKIEWLLYLSVPLIAWLSAKVKRKPMLIFSCIYIASALYRLFFYELYLHTGSETWHVLSRQFLGQLMYFYAGVFFYYYYDALMQRRGLLLIAALLIMIGAESSSMVEILLQPLAITAIVIILSMTGRWGTWEGKRDNVSYNIYLLHAPLIQTYAALARPHLLPAPLGLLAVTAVTFLFAILLSYAERPFRIHKK